MGYKRFKQKIPADAGPAATYENGM
jgi:hypothetical protein